MAPLLSPPKLASTSAAASVRKRPSSQKEPEAAVQESQPGNQGGHPAGPGYRPTPTSAGQRGGSRQQAGQGGRGAGRQPERGGLLPTGANLASLTPIQLIQTLFLLNCGITCPCQDPDSPVRGVGRKRRAEEQEEPQHPLFLPFSC